MKSSRARPKERRSAAEPSEDGHTAVARWSPSLRSVGMARRELRVFLGAEGLGAMEDMALLVLSELFTNAVNHARVPRGRQVETRFVRLGGGLRIEVHDAADERPCMLSPGPDSDGGRGLFLVAALASRWGVSERGGPGKAVWAELAGPVM
ncbi:ATP-binding protein [Streptomyces sp. NPDC003077]|uniref:ATP-binding protein n=1 Tax=Streptomyces sp. NPDC003077 TaxID=3154443 RepID=UPI0033AD99B3